MKQCSKCKQELPEIAFYPRYSKPKLQSSWCKNCISEQHKEYRERNKEKLQKYHKNYYANHEGELKEYQKNYRQNSNKELVRQAWNNWYHKNRDYVNANCRKYNREHREKALRKWRKKSANRKQELGYFELWDNPFPEEIPVHYHHVNNMIVIPIPELTHKIIGGRNTKEHREKINQIIEKIYGIELEKILEVEKA